MPKQASPETLYQMLCTALCRWDGCGELRNEETPTPDGLTELRVRHLPSGELAALALMDANRAIQKILIPKLWLH